MNNGAMAQRYNGVKGFSFMIFWIYFMGDNVE